MGEVEAFLRLYEQQRIMAVDVVDGVSPTCAIVGHLMGVAGAPYRRMGLARFLRVSLC